MIMSRFLPFGWRFDGRVDEIFGNSVRFLGDFIYLVDLRDQVISQTVDDDVFYFGTNWAGKMYLFL